MIQNNFTHENHCLRLLKILLSISIIEGIYVFLSILSISTDLKNQFIFGLSSNRIILLIGTLLILATLGYILIFAKKVNTFLVHQLESTHLHFILSFLGIYSIMFLWISTWLPNSDFGRFEALFIRLNPLLIWFELLTIQILLLSLYILKKINLENEYKRKSTKTALLIFLSILVLWIFITISKIGLVQNIKYWFEPGVPLSSFQFYGTLFFVIFILLFWFYKRPRLTKPQDYKITILLIIVIYLSTVLIWGLAEMPNGSYLSFKPTAPNFQPFPDSDAREHDLGAVSILKGEGIYFHGFTDKPIYMVFLSMLHLISNSNYNTMPWFQIMFLALIPVLLFLLGKKFINILFGILLAVLIIFQQRNAIVLTDKIYTVNPQQYSTELITLLGIILFVYLLFIWLRNHDQRIYFMLGGIIGALSLIRLNGIIFLPLCVTIGLFQLWSTKKRLLKQVFLLVLSFFLVFSPWLITGINSDGIPWFYVKILNVIDQRYNPISETNSKNKFSFLLASESENKDIETNLLWKTSNSSTTIITLSEKVLAKTSLPQEEVDNGKNIVYILVNHYLHNITTSILSLPDFVSFDINKTIKDRGYWARNNNWSGSISTEQYVFIVGNLGLISLGLAVSWKKYRWAGLVPLMIFLSYNLTLSLALSSGSRNIVPINWIIFFYYSLGLFYCLTYSIRFLFNNPVCQPNDITNIAINPIIKSIPSLYPALMLVIMLGSAIPIANSIVPRIINTSYDKNILKEKVNAIESEKGELLYGYMLYPYNNYDNNKFTFELLAENEIKDVLLTRNYPVQKIINFTVERKYLVDKKAILESDVPVALIFNTEQGKKYLSSIFVITEKSPNLIWQYEQ